MLFSVVLCDVSAYYAFGARERVRRTHAFAPLAVALVFDSCLFQVGVTRKTLLYFDLFCLRTRRLQ